MKQKAKDQKSDKRSKRKITRKEETRDKENERGGIPDLDFKKLIGCG